MHSLSLLIACLAYHEASAQIFRPAAERTGEVGCWITVDAELGKLSQNPIWHLDTYETRAEAGCVRRSEAGVRLPNKRGAKRRPSVAQ